MGRGYSKIWSTHIIIIISSEFCQLISNDYNDQLANKDLGATALPSPPLHLFFFFLHNYTHSIDNIIDSFKINIITTNFYIVFLQMVKVANFCCSYRIHHLHHIFTHQLHILLIRKKICNSNIFLLLISIKKIYRAKI